MKLLEKILFATDFSMGSDDALETAVSVAKFFDSEMILVHVIPDMEDLLLDLKALNEATTDRLRKIQETLMGRGVNVGGAVVLEGVPFDRISRYANANGVNVIMIGSGETLGKRTFRLGTTAERLVRNAAKPVWVVKEGSKPSIERILCAVDFSQPSARALKNAVHLSRNLGAHLTVLTVIPPAPETYLGLIRRWDKDKEAYDQAQGKLFDEFLEDFDFHGIDWEKKIRSGKPHREILETAQESSADLIVMGSLGKTGLERALLGSVAKKVLRDMPCSVITVKTEHAIRLKIEETIDDIESHYRQGVELMKKGFTVEAMQHFDHCVSVNPMYMHAWDGLAAAHTRLGHEERAEQARMTAKYIKQALWEKEVQSELQRHPWDKTK